MPSGYYTLDRQDTSMDKKDTVMEQEIVEQAFVVTSTEETSDSDSESPSIICSTNTVEPEIKQEIIEQAVVLTSTMSEEISFSESRSIIRSKIRSMQYQGAVSDSEMSDSERSDSDSETASIICEEIKTYDATPYLLYCCYICDFTCGLPRMITNHIKDSHPEEKAYCCPLAPCTFSSDLRHKVKSHITKVHFRKTFNCSECQYIGKNKSDLRDHTIGRHSNEKPYQCPKCPYKCKWRSALRSHLNQVHVEEKRFGCPRLGCGFRCKSQGTLTEHKNTGHVGHYGCSKCSRRFKDPRSLSRHLNFVHSAKFRGKGLWRYPD